MKKFSMPGGLPIEQRGADVFLTVRVQPKASRKSIRIEPDGRIRVSVTAPPAEGAANRALVEFLAEVFDLPKRAIVLHSGQKSRTKTFVLANTGASAIKARLDRIAGGEPGKSV